jgi:hypothetical protein
MLFILLLALCQVAVFDTILIAPAGYTLCDKASQLWVAQIGVKEQPIPAKSEVIVLGYEGEKLGASHSG